MLQSFLDGYEYRMNSVDGMAVSVVLVSLTVHASEGIANNFRTLSHAVLPH